jgi:hypothetical protein
VKLFNKVFTLFLVLTLAFSFTANTSSFAKGKGKGHGNVDPFSMEIFALNGQDATDVYIKVTKELEGYELPNELKKVQLKYVVNGETIVHNVKGIALAEGLYEVTSLTDLMAHETLEAKVHIHDNQTGDEEVLKGSTTVLLRSDVVVGDILTPEEMVAGETFSISFPVSEINGDIGGSTFVTVMNGDTVLYSTLIDVVAGEEVNVNVPVMFADPGTYDITVNANDMYYEHLGTEIADYDVSSNTNTLTVEVIPSTEPIYFSMGYVDYNEYYYYYYDYEYMYVQFYDNEYYTGEEVYDLTRGTLNIKVETDLGHSEEWNYDLSELAELAQETGASHYVYDNSYYYYDEYYEYYDNRNWENYYNYYGDYVGQYFYTYNDDYYNGSYSGVYFDNYINGWSNAESISVEATLTNPNGDTWTIKKDIIQDATYYSNDYYYKQYQVSGLTL